MKKNILVLTSIYPSAESSKGTTPVVHFFCKEWVAKGHNVVVIHNDNKYFILFYLLPMFIKKAISARFNVILPNYSMRKALYYELDGVKVLRNPMLKIFPYGRFFNYQLNRQTNLIVNFLKKSNFYPDIITGHWENPQIELITRLKKIYTNSRTSIVIHVIKYLKSNLLRNKLSQFDSIGFRNVNLLNQLDFFSENIKLYTCHSGVQENFLDVLNNSIILKDKFSVDCFSIVFVGLFIKRKFPTSIAKAINNLNIDREVKVDFIGEGSELKKVVKLMDKAKIRTRFHNRLPQQKIKEILIESQVFVMISENEAFGLVYLEALSCGCIVVASRNEGFDGIIIDGFNGFLCQAGDEAELELILMKINSLSKKEKEIISNNAIETAKNLTNEIVSNQYLLNITN